MKYPSVVWRSLVIASQNLICNPCAEFCMAVLDIAFDISINFISKETDPQVHFTGHNWWWPLYTQSYFAWSPSEQCFRTSLEAHWLRLYAPTEWVSDLIPVWGTKIPYATQHGQRKKKKKDTASFTLPLNAILAKSHNYFFSREMSPHGNESVNLTLVVHRFISGGLRLIR